MKENRFSKDPEKGEKRGKGMTVGDGTKEMKTGRHEGVILEKSRGIPGST